MSNGPLALYRRLLRLHSRLPSDLRTVGVGYVRDEFKRHKDVQDQQTVKMFLGEWQLFALMLEEQLKSGEVVGAKLKDTELDALSDEQVIQLQELFHETKKPT